MLGRLADKIDDHFVCENNSSVLGAEAGKSEFCFVLGKNCGVPEQDFVVQ